MRKTSRPKQGQGLLYSRSPFIHLTNISIIYIYGRGKGGNTVTN